MPSSPEEGDGAGPDAQKTDDFIVFRAERQFVAHEADAVAGGGLAGNGQIVGAGDGAAEDNVAAHVKHNRAVGLADGIAERARAAVVGVDHMIDGASASAGGIGAEAISAGEGEWLGRLGWRGDTPGPPLQRRAGRCFFS